MTTDTLPGEITIPTRDEERARWLRNYRIRNPKADTREGSNAYVDASVAADSMVPLYAKASIINKNSVLEDARGDALRKWGEREGVDGPNEAFPASGYVRMSTSAGGTTIQAGDQLIWEAGAIKFEALETRFYQDGASCSIIGVSTGPSTNLPPGTQLKWVSPRPGSAPTVTVVEQADGSGLSGGREAESDAEYLERILFAKANPAASGNDAEIQLAAEKTPSVAVQKAFTYPAILGSATTCVVFTMRPEKSGGSRVPNGAQVSLVEAHVEPQFPADDGLIHGFLTNEDASVVFGIRWRENSQGWEDANPWPQYREEAPSSGAGAVVVASVSSATSFVLATANGVYTGIAAPIAGQNIAFWNLADFAFRKKRIAAVSGSGPWTITVDTTNDVSDTSFTPAVSQRAMPWSDRLDELATGVRRHFDTLGPGEMVSTFFDAGRRQRRQPRPFTGQWPSGLTTRGLVDAVKFDAVEDAEPLEGPGTSPTAGTPGASANILKLNALAFFPEVIS